MKKINILIAVLLLTACSVMAQIPEAINFQAIARDGNSDVMINTNIQIRLTIIDSVSGGTEVYQELRSLTTNNYGSFSFQIGQGADYVTIGTFADINWPTGDKHLKIDYDPSNTFDWSLTLGTIELVSVPYAMASGSVTYIDLTGVQDGDVLIYNSTTSKFEPEQINSTPYWADIQNKPNFATVATSGDYNDLTNTPSIPTVPENVGDFNNDVGYLTEYSETDPEFTTWDKDYDDLTNTPTIPTVPTNVSEFTNDAGYVITDNDTQLTETEVDAMVSNNGYLTSETDPEFTAWDKDYSDLTNTPTIPTVPTNVSEFTNDAGYVTTDNDTQLTETEVDVMVSNNGYLTNEIQNLSEVLTQNNDAGATNITNLADPVNAQDAATKAYVDLLEARLDALETQMIISQGVNDIDGNNYSVVKIGDQIWMAENLKVTHYPNGDAIPLVTDNTAWGNLADDNTSDAYSYYNNNASSEADTYGALYTYAAAIADDWTRDLTANQGVCPDGWHLPTDAEWTTLETYLGTNAGSKLAGNAALWADGALDQSADFGTSGFSAFPSGFRFYYDGTFNGLGDIGYWWSATESGSLANCRSLDYDFTNVGSGNGDKSLGFSVRCVRD